RRQGRQKVPQLDEARSDRATQAAEQAKDELAELLGLPSVNLAITGARIVGQGSKATADLYLSNGTAIEFDSLRDFATGSKLIVEIVVATGAATPKLTNTNAQQAVRLLRQIATWEEGLSEDAFARDWGITYLQAAEHRALDMGSQEQRWQAFS